MKRIYFDYEVGQVGCGGNDCIEVADDITDEQLNDMAYQGACDWAESYGIYACDCEDEDCENDHDGSISGTWEIYNPEKHDGQKPGGGKWFDTV